MPNELCGTAWIKPWLQLAGVFGRNRLPIADGITRIVGFALPAHFMKITKLFFAAVLGISINAGAAADKLPKNILDQLPGGYEVLSTAQGLLDGDKLEDVLVVVHKKNEEALARKGVAPSRPLLLFMQNPDGTFTLARRNDHVVLKIDEGGQCDPFEDGEDGLVIKNRYFTVQHSVACGQHWRWFVTFRYERQLRDWVFHKAVNESWLMNNSTDPNADALIPGGASVISGKGKAPVLFEKYRDVR